MENFLSLRNKMFDCETRINNLVDMCLGQDSPDIILHNLSLVISLLANCRSHLDVKSSLSNLKWNSTITLKEKSLDVIKVEFTDKSDVNNDKTSSENFEKEVNKHNECLDDTNASEIKEDVEMNSDCDPLFEPEEIIISSTEDNCKLEIKESECERTNEKINFEDSLKIDDLDSMNRINTKTSNDGFSCDICNRTWQSNKALQKHKRMFDHEALRCNDCGRYFAYPKDLKRHLLSHSNEKPYCCDICGKTLKTKWNVQFHKERVHGNKTKELPCNICGKSFAYEEYLKSHMKIAHTTEKCWACEQCGVTFNIKQSLSRHMQTHTEERPYQCDICEKAFKSERDLGAHQQTHSIVKPYQCEECEVTLTHQSSMVRHYRTVHKIVKTVKYKPPVLISEESFINLPPSS